MQHPVQNATQDVRHRQRAAIVGGGRLALETFALLVEDSETEVVGFWDSDKTTLIYRLADLGFSFADHLRPKILDNLKELNEIGTLDFIIDTSGNLQTRRSLVPLLGRRVRVLSGPAAQLLWSLKLGKEVDLGPDLEELIPLLAGIERVEDESEFFEILLQISTLLTYAKSAALYVVKPEGQDPVLAYTVIQSVSVDDSNGLNYPRREPFNLSLIQKAIELKRPVVLPDDDQRLSLSPSGRGSDSNRFTRDPNLIQPIMMEDEVLGVLALCKDSSSGPFTPESLNVCARLGNLGAKYLSKFLHFQEIKERSTSEMIRSEVKAIVNSQFSLQEKLAKGAEKISKVLRCHAHFYVKDRLSEDFVLQASTTQASQVCGMMRVREGEGFVGEVAQQLSPVFLKGDIPGSSSGRQQALLCLPLHNSAGLWGILCIEQLPLGLGTRKTLNLLEELAEIFAQVIAGDLEHHRISQKLLRLSVVQEEGLQLLSVMDREQLMTMIAASGAMLVDAEAVILRVFEKKGKRLLIGSTYGLHKNEMDTRLVGLDSLIALKAFQSSSQQVLEELKRVDQTLPSKFPYRYGVCRPLVYEGVAAGTLSVYNKLTFQSFGCTPFDQDDLEILEKFSYYAGKALINLQEAQARSALITIDELTGLRNERYLTLRLPEEIRRAERYQRSLSLMVFEVESEAPVKPAPGSPAEKDFIKQVAEVLEEKFRNVDIVVRVKGTQFAILMPDTGETVTDAAARLARGLSILPLKILMGYSTYPTDAKTVQDLIAKASKLSEMAKKS
jgi:diguanylate cyclase (GGDEF)-like protein